MVPRVSGRKSADNGCGYTVPNSNKKGETTVEVTKTKGSATVVIDKVEFDLDRGELETLATKYIEDRLDYEWDRFAHPEDGISSGEFNRYMFAFFRLEDIQVVLGAERIAELRKSVEQEQIRRCGEERWAEFTREP
jgi:hypothetical protein